MMKPVFPLSLASLKLPAAALAWFCAAAALPAPAQNLPRSGSSVLLEEVTVTARKREESAQETPLSVTAFNAEQIDALKVRDLTHLSVGMPNVSLDDIGTNRGIANFSIRGLGINSSIPSIDPTVGLFVNGVYLGINNGVIFDMFDLQSVEVLRGPQGTLFGRNVTGGAVLLTTKKPGDQFAVTARAAVDTATEGGLNTYYSASVGGPVADNFGARLALYFNDDDGPFENDFTGDDFGKIEQFMARGTTVWTPTGDTEIVVRYEYNETDGDGPAGQSHTNGSGVAGSPVNNDRDGFDFSIDEEGFQNTQTHFISAQLDQRVGLGEAGKMTAIFGYRKHASDSLSDIDSQPTWLFHAPFWVETEQTSLEVRYNGLFGDANITVGAFYLDNDVDYHERRELLGVATGGAAAALTQSGGGLYDVENFTLFAQTDYQLTPEWILTAGVNYSYEKKDARIASLPLNINSSCNIVNGPACPFDFIDDESWDNVAPKLGLTYLLDDKRRIYVHWSRGYRSGGYNLRNADPAFSPGPFDEEEVSNVELGYKSAARWGRLNVAVFRNQINDLQREVNLPSSTAGVVQVIRNTADATVAGIEVDGAFALTDNLALLASVGYIDASYDRVTFDLNGDGEVNDADKSLALPRAPELTWSVGFTHDLYLGGWGYATSRINWAYRDDYAFTDNNRGYFEAIDMVDSGVDFHSNDGAWVLSVYGRNLLNEVRFGGDTQLPADLGGAPLGGTFSPLAPGRRYGVEVTYHFRG